MGNLSKNVWQVQQAKQQLSQLLQSAVQDGPQFISKHGQDFAVVISIDEFSRLKGGDFKEHLRAAPDLEILEIVRSREPGKTFEFE